MAGAAPSMAGAAPSMAGAAPSMAGADPSEYSNVRATQILDFSSLCFPKHTFDLMLKRLNGKCMIFKLIMI